MRTTRLDRIGAASRAQQWLHHAATPNSTAAALRDLGLLLCNRIHTGVGGPLETSANEVELPSVARFVEMTREDLLRLTLPLALLPASHVRIRDRARWARCFGAVAVSYARTGDLPVVAVLVRSAAHLLLCTAWLVEAEEYLLDQQRSDGAFGLAVWDPAVVGGDEQAAARLRLTVEVLWALTETSVHDDRRSE
jgi:hypothetical protein